MNSPTVNMEKDRFQIVPLSNGSHTIRSTHYGETFHPVVGPAAEAEILYARQLQLRERLLASPAGFTVWDVGLGAAANALTAIRYCSPIQAELHLISFDRTLSALKFALDHQEFFPYLDMFQSPVRELIHSGHASFACGQLQVHWTYVAGDFNQTMTSWPGLPPHAVLYDAHSPAKNPDMWTLGLFQRLHLRLSQQNAGSNLATYSRSTLLRVTLLLAGFWTGTGSATGEKEETTLAATDPRFLQNLLDERWLRRAIASRSAEPLHTAAYQQRPLTHESRTRLLAHPQFSATLIPAHESAITSAQHESGRAV